MLVVLFAPKAKAASFLDFLSGTTADDYQRKVDEYNKNQDLARQLLFDSVRREQAEKRAKAHKEMSEKMVEALANVLNGTNPQKGLHEFVDGDYATALKEWEPLAEQGIAEAQFNLGQLYYTGKGAPQNYKQAATWYAKAGEQGYASGLNNLGVMFKKGEGFPQNYIQACALYNVAASLGSAEGVQNRDAIQMLMTPSQISEAQNLSQKIYDNSLRK